MLFAIHLQEKPDCWLVFLDPIHIVLFADPDGICFPLVKISLPGFGVEPELGLRCEVIEHFSHQMSAQSRLIALQMKLGENVLQRIVSVIQKLTILNGVSLLCYLSGAYQWSDPQVQAFTAEFARSQLIATIAT